MSKDNDLSGLQTLPEVVLSEVVREGELQLQAQLQTALAADSRALTIGGSCLTASTALFGASAALSKAMPADFGLALIAAGLAVSILVAGGLAIYAARPVSFGFAGNDPKQWLPGNWRSMPRGKDVLKLARIEQAATLQEIIEGNRHTSAANARLVRAAVLVAYFSTAIAGASLSVVLGYRYARSAPAGELVSPAQQRPY